MDEDLEFKQYIQAMGAIVVALVIERDEDTLNLSGEPLLKTAEIELEEHQVWVEYDDDAKQFLNEKIQAVLDERDEQDANCKK